MDKEIAYAKAAGLNYFAYVLFDAASHLSDALYLHLSSATKNDVKLAVIHQGHSVGSTEWYATYKTRLLSHFADSAYQKVTVGGQSRPLVYIFNGAAMSTQFGNSYPAAAAALSSLAADSVALGYGNPYYVVLYTAAASKLPTDAEALRANLGAHAVSAYISSYTGATGNPYPAMAASEAARWTDYKNASPGNRKVVPWVTTGYDHRPRYENPTSWDSGSPNYTELAKPSQIASQLQAAIDWVGANSGSAEANAVLIYAWNEFDEGGWLCPTLEEGPARLTAIAGVLGAAGIPNANSHVRNWTFTSSAESWTAYYQLTGFSFNATAPGTINGVPSGIDPQFLSADSLGTNIGYHPLVTVGLKNATAGTFGQIFFTTNASTTFDGTKRRDLTISTNDTTYKNYVFNMADLADWKGTLKRLRLDPEHGASGGTVSVDYVRITDSIPSSRYEDSSLAMHLKLDEAASDIDTSVAYNSPATNLYPGVADSSGNGLVGVVKGGLSWTTGKVGNAAQLNGTDSYVLAHDSNYLDGMSQLTVSVWIYPTWFPTSPSDYVLPVSKDFSFRLLIGQNGGTHLAVATTNNTWYSANTVLGFGVIPLNQWTHLAATYDGTNLRTYVNGALVATSAGAISGTIVDTATDLYLGYGTVTAQLKRYSGLIDEVLISRRALTGSEIAQIYQDGL